MKPKQPEDVRRSFPSGNIRTSFLQASKKAPSLPPTRSQTQNILKLLSSGVGKQTLKTNVPKDWDDNVLYSSCLAEHATQRVMTRYEKVVNQPNKANMWQKEAKDGNRANPVELPLSRDIQLNHLIAEHIPTHPEEEEQEEDVFQQTRNLMHFGDYSCMQDNTLIDADMFPAPPLTLAMAFQTEMPGLRKGSKLPFDTHLPVPFSAYQQGKGRVKRSVPLVRDPREQSVLSGSEAVDCGDKLDVDNSIQSMGEIPQPRPLSVKVVATNQEPSLLYINSERDDDTNGTSKNGVLSAESAIFELAKARESLNGRPRPKSAQDARLEQKFVARCALRLANEKNGGDDAVAGFEVGSPGSVASQRRQRAQSSPGTPARRRHAMVQHPPWRPPSTNGPIKFLSHINHAETESEGDGREKSRGRSRNLPMTRRSNGLPLSRPSSVPARYNRAAPATTVDDIGFPLSSRSPAISMVGAHESTQRVLGGEMHQVLLRLNKRRREKFKKELKKETENSDLPPGLEGTSDDDGQSKRPTKQEAQDLLVKLQVVPRLEVVMPALFFDWIDSNILLDALDGDDDLVPLELTLLFKGITDMEDSREQHNFANSLKLLHKMHSELMCPVAIHQLFWTAHSKASSGNAVTIISRLSLLNKCRNILMSLLRALVSRYSQLDKKVALEENGDRPITAQRFRPGSRAQSAPATKTRASTLHRNQDGEDNEAKDADGLKVKVGLEQARSPPSQAVHQNKQVTKSANSMQIREEVKRAISYAHVRRGGDRHQNMPGPSLACNPALLSSVEEAREENLDGVPFDKEHTSPSTTGVRERGTLRSRYRSVQSASVERDVCVEASDKFSENEIIIYSLLDLYEEMVPWKVKHFVFSGVDFMAMLSQLRENGKLEELKLSLMTKEKS